MKFVQDPRHPQRALHSVSVGGKEYFLENGTIDGVPDHLAKNFEGHGLMPEGDYVLYMAKKAEEEHVKLEQEARDEETRKAIQSQHMEMIAEEERVRAQARFAEENRLRERANVTDDARKSLGGTFENKDSRPTTDDPEMQVNRSGDVTSKASSRTTAGAVETGGRPSQVDLAMQKAGPRSSVPMTPKG
jgi:hypothetical protein